MSNTPSAAAKEDSSVRIEIALRAAHLAKCCLELLNLQPQLASLQMRRITEELSDLHAFLRSKGL